MAQTIQKGGISVQTEHIFPVIKRWLYSDKEIFLRELVSNASDAVTKMKRLVSLGEAQCDDAYAIRVTVDKALKTLTVSDNGIGMSRQEVEKYICQIALSGALEFIEKYEGESGKGGGIIGHFGLGFYSAFMVSDRVELVTKSFAQGQEAVKWVCNENGEYEMSQGERKERGTDVILHVTDEEKEFLSKAKVEELLKKYCAFMPVEIFVEEVGEEKPEEPKSVNDTAPLWLRSPSECTEEDYKNFYHQVFDDFNDPLFYVHINADFPLNFKGILYFPKLTHEYANLEGQVKLYYNQVFVADNIKEVIPDYLMLLKGVLDCPELPLNVSRSYLQNSNYVAKVSQHIIKKVCDKLKGLFVNDRERLESVWDDIKPFVEYGCMRDGKFFDRVKEILLYKIADGRYLTPDEYLARVEEKTGGKKIYYATDLTRQASYVTLFGRQEIPVAVLDAVIDSQFIQFMENQNAQVKFVRIDSDVDGVLKQEESQEESQALKELFTKVVAEGTQIVTERLKSTDTPAMIVFSEEERRFEDMMKFYSRRNGTEFPTQNTQKLLVNLSCPLVARLEQMAKDGQKEDTCLMLARQVYMLGVLAQRPLEAEETQRFIQDTLTLLDSIQ